MPKVMRSLILNYGIAVVAVALALPLTLLLWPIMAPSAVPFFFAAVMVASWYGGLGPGLLATGLSTLAVAYYFTPLHYSAITSLEDITRPGVFTLVALLTSWLNSERRRSEQRHEKRIREQTALVELARSALSGRDLSALMEEATALVAGILEVEFSALFEPLPDGHLLLRAGKGWREGSVGKATIDAKETTAPGYDLLSSEPVRIKDLRAVSRPKDSHLLYEHEVVSGLSVIVRSQAGPMMVLGVFTARSRSFREDEICFLRSVADLLAAAVERRRLEEESHRGRDFSERLIDNSGDGFFVFDRDCRYILWNAGMERISGISRTDALGKSAFDLFPSLREMGEDSYFLDTLQGKSAVSLDIPHIFPTGQDGFIDTHYWPLRDRAGEIIGGLALVYDATERKRIEDERLRLIREDAVRREAEAAERRSAFLAEVCSALASSTEYQATLSAVASIVVSEMADWCIVDIVETNGSFRRLSVAHRNPCRAGLSLEIERLFSLEPRSDSVAPFGPLLTLNNGELDMVSEVAETWLAAVSRDASHLKNLQGLGLKSYICVPLQARGRILGAMTVATRDRYGRVDLGLAEDIARHCALAIDNARLYEELQEANRFKDQFLGTVSHQLHTPLPLSEPVIADCGLRISDYQPLNLQPEISEPQSDQQEIHNSFEVIVIDTETEPCGMQINHKDTKDKKALQ